MNLNVKELTNLELKAQILNYGALTMMVDMDQKTNASLDSKLLILEENNSQNALMVKISKDKP